MTRPRTRLAYLALTLAIIAAGLLVRWPGLGLPWLFAKYAGSILWGAKVFMALRTLTPGAHCSDDGLRVRDCDCRRSEPPHPFASA